MRVLLIGVRKCVRWWQRAAFVVRLPRAFWRYILHCLDFECNADTTTARALQLCEMSYADF